MRGKVSEVGREQHQERRARRSRSRTVADNTGKVLWAAESGERTHC